MRYSDTVKDEDPIHEVFVLFSYRIPHSELQHTMSRTWLDKLLLICYEDVEGYSLPQTDI